MSLMNLSGKILLLFVLLSLPVKLYAESAGEPKPKVINAVPVAAPEPVGEKANLKQKDSVINTEIAPSSSGTDEAILSADKETVSFKLPSAGWAVVTKKVNKVQSIIEFAPAGHTAQDWRELISFQSYLVQNDVTVDEFARQISDHCVIN